MEKYNIGITIGMINDFKALESNALLMNAFYLYDCIEKTNSYKPYILICDATKDEINKNINKKTLTYYEKEYNFIYFSLENIKILDILASVFYDFTNNYYNVFKNIYPNMKFIHISYGNTYIIDVCYYLYLENDTNNLDLQIKENENCDIFKELDQVWISPHFEYSKSYYKVKYNIPYNRLLIAPYIWDTRIQKIRNKDLNYNFEEISYDKVGINIGIFEANLHLIKNCMMPLYISEDFYNNSKYKNKLKSVHLTNILRMVKKTGFIKNIQSLELFKDNKLKYEYNATRIPHYPKYNNINLVICHQIYNDLNYLHFELASLGIPFIHNCKAIEGMGYYYEGFDINKAIQLIDYIYQNHNPHLNNNYENFIKAYNERNQKVIYKYSVYNIVNIKAIEENLNKLYT
jgi:hypothetical protein